MSCILLSVSPSVRLEHLELLLFVILTFTRNIAVRPSESVANL